MEASLDPATQMMQEQQKETNEMLQPFPIAHAVQKEQKFPELLGMLLLSEELIIIQKLSKICPFQGAVQHPESCSLIVVHTI